MNRDLALLLMALRHGLDVLLQEPATDSDPIHSNGDDESRELDDEDIRYLASIAYQVNERVIDEIKGWDAFNGVLLGAIFAIFLLLLDKVESFTWWPILALIVPSALTTWNLSGDVLYSPKPRKFGTEFFDDPQNAVLNLIEDHNNDIEQNSRLRSRKRTTFWLAFGILLLVCLVAAASKEYTIVHHDQAAADKAKKTEGDKASAAFLGAQKASQLQLRPRPGTTGGVRRPSHRAAPGPSPQATQ